jgi:signal transduction histidine kinase
VLINILGNALKFTETGSITLRMRWRDSFAEFEIEDTGQGISTNELEKVFEALSRRKADRDPKREPALALP